MLNRITFYGIIGLFLLGAAGCSTSQQTTPDFIEDSNYTSNNQGENWGSFILNFDPQTNEMSIEPDRDAAYHLNVTGYLNPPACGGTGCLSVNITNWDPAEEIFTVEVGITNPTNFTVSDLRLIFYNLGGKTILNPDSYTNSFVPAISPFLAFSKANPDREFVGGTTETRELFLHWPAGATGGVPFKVTAWLWTNCEEPYEVFDAYQSGVLTPVIGDSMIGCLVFDWQNNVTDVTVDTTPLTGGITNLNHIFGDLWNAYITNSQGAPPGIYPSLITATSPNPQGFDMYNYLDIEVLPFTGAVHTIDIVGFDFDPDVLDIALGDAVIWTNLDTALHTTTSGDRTPDGLWHSPDLEQNDQFAHVFDALGLYLYFCAIHPSMTAEINVF